MNAEEVEMGKNTIMYIAVTVALNLFMIVGMAHAKEVLTEKARFRDYLVKVFRDDDTGGGRVVVFRKGKTVFRMQGEPPGKFRIGDINGDKARNAAIPAGRDITGRGIPNLVISEWTGGAHCCYSYYVFEMGDTFRQIAKLDISHADLSHFEDLDNNGMMKFVTADFTFAYWKTSFADSPAPDVILTFRDRLYRLDARHMHKPPPAEQVLFEMAEQVRTDEAWRNRDQPSGLWRIMLDLIYSGNADSAWKFFDKAWPENVQGKDQFFEEFKAQLKTSPYWVEIRRMNATGF